ncbi:hypothetical protein CONPUDRAFT_67707, partial [Coniophora puteana RWD-64-598 SS2]
MNAGRERPEMVVGDRTITPKTSHKLLGAILDQGLRWKEQVAAAMAKGAAYSAQLWRLSRMSAGMPLKAIRKLHTTVVLTKTLYAADVWLRPPLSWGSTKEMRGSLTVIKKIASLQRGPLLTMTGALRSSPTDILEIMANMRPISLTVQQMFYNAALRLAALPPVHPLAPVYQRAAKRLVKHHQTAIHLLAHRCKVRPGEVETLNYPRLFVAPTPVETHIAKSRKEAVEEHAGRDRGVEVYTDGSGHGGRIGAAAVMVRVNGTTKVLRYHLGSDQRHTVFEAELVGILLAMELL